MTRIWTLKKEQGIKKLPLIIPMLIYHGREKWNIGLYLNDIIKKTPVEAKEYVPNFKYILFDLSNYSKEEIKGTGQMRVFVDVLSAVFQDDFEEKIHDAIRVLEELEEKNKAVGYFKTVVEYIIGTDHIDININEVEKIVGQVSKEKEGEIMSIAEELRKEGKKEAQIEMVKNLLKEGVAADIIAKSSELSEEEIKRLQAGMKH